MVPSGTRVYNYGKIHDAWLGKLTNFRLGHGFHRDFDKLPEAKWLRNHHEYIHHLVILSHHELQRLHPATSSIADKISPTWTQFEHPRCMVNFGYAQDFSKNSPISDQWENISPFICKTSSLKHQRMLNQLGTFWSNMSCHMFHHILYNWIN